MDSLKTCYKVTSVHFSKIQHSDDFQLAFPEVQTIAYLGHIDREHTQEKDSEKNKIFGIPIVPFVGLYEWIRAGLYPQNVTRELLTEK